MKVFISGGCKNGKSRYAQILAKRMRKPAAPLYYLATMIPADDEDRLRIEEHRRQRSGWGFQTVEAGMNILEATKSCDAAASFLLDSVTALLANEMFDRQGNIMPDAPRKIAGELTELAEKVDDIVFVSDYIYSDACLYDPLTEAYRKGLAMIDRILARICDSVLELSAGNIIHHKSPSLTKLNGLNHLANFT